MAEKDHTTDPYKTQMESVPKGKGHKEIPELVTAPGQLVNSQVNPGDFSLEKKANFPRLPNYEITRVLGQGGMGVVYLANDLTLNRVVAIKMIRERVIGSEGLDRFQREQQVLAQLEDPGVVKLFNYGVEEGRPWFAMEYCQGGTLDTWLKENAHQEDGVTVAQQMVQVALAIHSAHQAGILHRDLKPGNIFLSQVPPSMQTRLAIPLQALKSMNKNPLFQYQLKVGDFGLARSGKSSSVTKTGIAMGTPSYMAPEQARGDKIGVGSAADVYGLGGILYTLLTQRRPFEGTLEQVLRDLHDRAPPPPSNFNTSLHKDLETICLKCLEKKPGNRYGSAMELANDLERFTQGMPISARPYTEVEKAWRWCLRNNTLALAMVSAMVFLLIGAVVSGIFAVKAGHQRNLANQLLISERKERERADSLDYQTHIRSAQMAWDAGRADLAMQNLEKCPWDFRGFGFSYLATQFLNKQIIFRDHLRRVNCANFSPDRKNILTASADHTVKVWDTWKGELLFTLEGHKEEVTYALYSPDGKRAASASFDQTIILWNLEQRKAEKILRGHLGRILAVIFSPDGKTLASGGDDGTIRIWDASTGAEIMVPMVSPAGMVFSLMFDSKGKRLVSGGEATLSTPGVHLWDVQKGGAPLAGFSGPFGTAFNVLITPDDSQIVAGCGDQTIYAWDILGKSPAKVFKGHGGRVYCIDVSPDGQFLVSGGGDQALKVWNLKSGVLLRTLQGHTGNVYGVAFCSQGRFVASCSEDTSARVWDLNEDYGPETIPLKKGTATRFAFSPVENILATVGKEGWLQVVSISEKKEIWSVHAHEGFAFGVAFSPDGEKIATSGMDGKMHLWDRHSGNKIHSFLGHRGKVLDVAFSPDGKKLGSAGELGGIRIWDTNDFKEIFVVAGHKGKVYSLDFSPDGAFLASAGEDGLVKIWDSQKGIQVNSLRASSTGSEEIIGVAYNPKGNLLASSCRNFLTGDKVVIWELSPEGKETGNRRELEGHYSFIYGLDFNPNGSRIITGSGDHTIKFWEVDNGTEILTIHGHTDIVSGVGFNRTGNLAASCSGENFIRLWSAQKELEFRTLDGHSDTVKSVAFSPDGKWIASSGDDKNIILRSGISGRLLQRKTGFPQGISRVAFSADSKVVLIEDAKGVVSGMDTEYFSPLSSLPPFPKQSQLASADGRMNVWRLGETGSTILILDLQVRQNNRQHVEEMIRRWEVFPPGFFLGRAMQALAEGNGLAAKNNFDILLQEEPWQGVWHAGISLAQAQLGNAPQAASHLMRALFLHPDPFTPLKPK
ncbi:MAG: hypothetical protein EXR99_10755 [Gemmataceae bacterium]|nr:hypothetical protein [Gemmataceae bacterium]